LQASPVTKIQKVLVGRRGEVRGNMNVVKGHNTKLKTRNRYSAVKKRCAICSYTF